MISLLTGRGRPASSPLAGRSAWQRHGGAPGPEHDAQRSGPGLGVVLPTAVDYAVVGGGFAGLATALALAEAEPGSSIVVLEARFVGFGASGRNAGLLSPLPAPLWLASADTNDEHRWGLAHLNRRVHETARWLAAAAPDCEIAPKTLRLEAQGNLTATGLARVARLLDRAGLEHRAAAGPAGHLALDLSTHAVDPYRTVRALARLAEQRGVLIAEDISVQEVAETPAAVKLNLSDGRSLLAKAAVVCTNAYSALVKTDAKIGAKVVHNYMVATQQVPPEQLARRGLEHRFVVELNMSYVYYRVENGRVIYGGIERFKPYGRNDFAVPEDVLARLEWLLARSFPGADLRPAEAWGGVYHQTPTDLPIIRRTGARGAVVLNVGYGGTGVAMAMICGRLAAALARGGQFADANDQRLHATLDTTRAPVGGLVRFVAGVAGDLMLRRRPTVPNNSSS